MANLFDKAKAKSTSKVIDKHEVVEIEGYENDLTRLSEIDAKIAELEAERNIIDMDIKDAAKEAMIKLYEKKNAFPGSIKVVSGTRSFLFITSDKYLKIDEDRAKELARQYDESIISEKTVFTLNPELVEKYAEVLSNLIMGSKKITEEDKERLIESKTTWSIAKGAIEKLRNSVFAKFDLSQLIEDIRPIFSVKSNKE